MEFTVQNKKVVTLIPTISHTDTHIVFFHGGAYVLQASAMHWNLIESIGLKANCKISFIDYPLSPEHTYRNTFEMVQQSYNLLTTQYPTDNFMLMGDSAGGGLAMAFAQKLISEKVSHLPIKNILFSPWLDISLKNPDIQNVEKLDDILALKDLITVGKKYAGGEMLDNYLLSPINGNLRDMCSTLVFYGSNELFYPDCEKLQKMTQHNPKFSFELFPQMPHDWVILPILEAESAVNIAVDFILES